MKLFYTPDIEQSYLLPDEEANHAIKVLRLKKDDEITLMDGKGFFYEAKINDIRGKKFEVEITGKSAWEKTWRYTLHIAIAPTKNIDRTEWFIEKAVEVGIDKITFIKSEHSERKAVNMDRIMKIAVSAAKQSLKGTLPEINGMTDFNDFVRAATEKNRLIAHCYDTPKTMLKDIRTYDESCLIMIGPEGDFSEKEIAEAAECGFAPVSLGENRLRTETAALVSCITVNIANQRP